MLGLPADAWYVWLGLAATSAAVLGTAVGLPTAAPPDAAPAARTVDAVATARVPSTAAQPLEAREVRVTAAGVSLRTDGGTDRAAFAEHVTPAPPDEPALRAVLTGDPAARQFDSPAALAASAAEARRADPDWRRAPDRLLVRRVSWGGVDVTLVG